MNSTRVKRNLWIFSLLIALLPMEAVAQLPHSVKIRYSAGSREPVFQAAVQDRKGFLWLGAASGLYRFDGLTFRHFKPSGDSVEISVSAIYCDPQEIIWAGCTDGRIFSLENNRPTLFQPEEGTAQAAISDILTDSDGALWWSTLGEGIYCFSGGRVMNFNHTDGLSDDYVYDLEAGPDGLILAGTDNGLSQVAMTPGGKLIRIPGVNSKLPDVIVRVIKTGPDGKTWLGFHDAPPGYIDPSDTSSFISATSGFENFGPVSDFVFPGGEVWFSTSEGKVMELSANSVRNIEITGSGHTAGKISGLAEDAEGNVWVLSASGLYRTSGARLRFYKMPENAGSGGILAIRASAGTPRQVWFSTPEGLRSMDPESGQVKELQHGGPDRMQIMSLHDDLYGFLWAGTFNHGVFRIDPRTGRSIRLTEKDGLVNDNVLSISSHFDTIWLATLGGATEIILGNSRLEGPFRILPFDRDNGLVSNYIYSVFEDDNDRIWFATDGDGISVMENGKFRSYGKGDGLEDDVVYSIAGDSSGGVWIATASSGIYRFDGSRFVHYGTDEGLSGTAISGMVISGDEVVILQENGLDIISISSGKILRYGEAEGLGGLAPNLNVMSRDLEGSIWIGTARGIIRYRPSAGRITGPVTVLEEMSVFLEPVAMEPGMDLSSGDNHVSFRYSGTWHSNPENVAFQVMLEGYDLGWIGTSDRIATYSSLPPGDYVFRVRSSITGNFRNATEDSFRFSIRQPVWQSAWFLLLATGLIVSIVIVLIRIREKRLKQIEARKKEKIEFEFQVLKNQVNPHFLFNSFSTLISLIEEHPSEAVLYTEKLSDFFRTILQLKDQEVIPVKDELAIAETYFFLVKKRFGKNIDLQIDLDLEALSSYIPPLTLQILLENAVKHNIISKDKPLWINILSENGKITVENKLQPKISPERSTGIGLENIMRRYRLKAMQEPVIEKTEQVFRVVLPLIS